MRLSLAIFCVLLLAGVRCTGSTTIQVGGAESGMAQVNDKMKLQMKAKRLAEEKTEFVINSKEELVAIMDCTACKRVVMSLSNRIIGRISSNQYAGGDTEPIITKLIRGVCSTDSIKKTREIVTACEEFIGDAEDILIEQFFPRTQEDDDLFEETFPVTKFCRTETTFCPPGTKSLDELLGGRIDEQDIAKEEAQKSKRKKAAKKRRKKEKKKKRKKEEKKKAKEAEGGTETKRRRRTRQRVRNKKPEL